MDTTTLESLLQEAAAAAEARNYWAAIDSYTQLLARTSPESGDAEVHRMRLAALSRRGELLRQLGEHEAALAGFNQYYLEAGSSSDAVEALVSIGAQHSQMGNYSKAMEALHEGQHLAQALNLTPGRAKTLYHIGLTNYRLGRIEDALSNLYKALALFQQLEDRFYLMRTWNTIGITHHQAGEIDKAIHAYKIAVEYARYYAPNYTATTLSNLGESYQDLFDMAQAVNYHREALRLVEPLKLESTEADLRRNLGVDLCALGELEEGVALLYQALRISRSTGNPEIEMQSLYSLALAELERNHDSVAREHIRELAEMAESSKARVYLARANYALGLYHKKQGNFSAAEEAWHQSLFQAHETAQRLLLWRIHASLGDIAPNQALADVHHRIAAEVIQQIAEPIEDEAVRAVFLNSAPIQAVLTPHT